MSLAAYMAFGYFAKGPPSEEASREMRTGRAAVMDKAPGYLNTGIGKAQCGWCWQHGVSASACRCVGKGLRGHPAVLRSDGAGGPDFDSTLLGKRVVVTPVQNDKRAFAGIVTAFNAGTGRHTVKLDGGEVQQHYLGYFPPKRMTVSGACAAPLPLRARALPLRV
jgi:hypothetical protein